MRTEQKFERYSPTSNSHHLSSIYHTINIHYLLGCGTLPTNTTNTAAYAAAAAIVS
jgi:hypothetical protein